MSKKMCSKCRFLKDLDQFPGDKRRPDGVGTVCKECKQKSARLRRGATLGAVHQSSVSRKSAR